MERIAVLIIDDDLILLDALRRTMALRLPDIHVEVSPSAQGALELLAARPYDLALCDVRMPVMDGHQFLIQAQRLYPDMPVLIMSGHTDEGEMRRTLEEGAAAVLYKPFDRDEVVVKIRETLRTRRHADRLPDSGQR
jgi:DNA-binding NtrC family response regulator